VVAAEREEAINSMNAKLKRKLRKIEKMVTDTREANLRFYYNMGRELIEARDDPDEYGRNALGKLERAMSTQKRTLRKTRQFAETYSPERLEALLALEHEGTGFRIHWGHLTYLLGLNTEKQQDTWAAKAVRNLWDPPTLHAQIKKRFPGRGVGGGRPHKLPATVHMQIRQMMEVTRNWVNKRHLWDGADENVFANIINEAPDQLEEIDKENLEATKELLANIIAQAPRMVTQLDECIARLDDVFEQRAKDAEAAAERETAAGKQHRAIDLEGSKKGATGRRRWATTPA
jgi:hypothetical protein